MWREQARGCKLAEYVLTEEDKLFVARWVIRYREFILHEDELSARLSYPDSRFENGVLVPTYKVFEAADRDSFVQQYNAFSEYGMACIDALARQLVDLVEEMGE
jgi:nitric oxide synthase oxygenase domain/subunit